MEALYILLPLTIVIALIVAVVLVLSVRSGQFDDLEGPAYRILADDEKQAQQEGAEDGGRPASRDS